jgi:hypothetical protein
MTEKKNVKKIILDFGQGRIIIPAKFTNEQEFGNIVKKRMRLADSCIRERQEVMERGSRRARH